MEHSPSWEANSSSSILCFVDRASLYNLVNKTNVVHNFSCMFISILYMFRANMCPSSGKIVVSMRHLVFVTLCGWPSAMKDKGILHTRRSSTQSDKYQVSHWYSNFSWWWAHSCLKHVENRNKHSRKIVHHVGFIYKISGKSIIRTGWLQSTVRLPDFIANSHLSPVLRSFVYNLWDEQWADQGLHEDTHTV